MFSTHQGCLDLRQRLHMRTPPKAGSELLGSGSRELVVLDAGKRNSPWGLALGTLQLQTKATPTSSSSRTPGRDFSVSHPGLSHPPPRLPHSLHHPEGHHVWKHTSQALGSHVADAVIVQAVGNRPEGGIGGPCMVSLPEATIPRFQKKPGPTIPGGRNQYLLHNRAWHCAKYLHRPLGWFPFSRYENRG